MGSDVAQLAWETFTDFLKHRNARSLFGDAGLPTQEELAASASATELLSFVVWAHDRAIRQAFEGRADPDLVRRSLDALQDGICDLFLDAGAHLSDLVRLERELAIRRSEYSEAAGVSAEELEHRFARRLAEGGGLPEDEVAATAFSLARATLDTVEPLRGYLTGFSLVG